MVSSAIKSIFTRRHSHKKAKVKMFAFVVLALFASASANVYFDTKCPEFKGVENFNYPAYANGKWYGVARYPNSAEGNSNCGFNVYTLEGDVFKMKNRYVINNKYAFIEGSGWLAKDAGNTGKLIYSLPYGISGKNTDTAFWILHTDYDNYAIGYYCKYDEERKSRQDFAWILSRTSTLSPEIKTVVDNLVKESKFLDSSKFIWPDFSDKTCNL